TIPSNNNYIKIQLIHLSINYVKISSVVSHLELMGDRRGIRKGGPYANKWLNATASENSDDDANTGDHGPSKKSKPNSDAPLPETGKAKPFTSNSTSLTPDRHIEPKAIVFTPSSTSSKTSNQFPEQISSKTPAQHSSASSNWSTLSNGLYNRREDKNFLGHSNSGVGEAS
ncbi:hypothetical protein O6P43_026389, partial [Quillaja saponaria]